MKVLFATTNEGKLKEFKNIIKLLGYDLEVLSLKDFELIPEAVEDGATFLENACAKAKYYYDAFKICTFADDSGLVVDALGGAPGINSARFAGVSDKTLRDKANNELLLKKMEGINDRCAHFACVMVYFDGKALYSYYGKVEGEIGYTEEGINGFGYDPLFLVDGVSLALMDDDQKDQLSHRYNALKGLLEELESKFIIKRIDKIN